jgi:hypothetical protein
MGYIKLTKRQRKDRDRIEAWLKGEPFRENSRAKPAIPELTREQVFETYVPGNISDGGQFFTPEEMADYVIDYYGIRWAQGKLLDPCAGIGHLLLPFDDYDGETAIPPENLEIDAWEIDRECVEVGKKLFPWVNWHSGIPFDSIEEIEGQYDYVVMNPPYSTKWGLYGAETVTEGRWRKSEHLFLELAIRALKEGGQLVVIAPYNFTQKIPKSGRDWFAKHATVENTTYQELPGEFRFTKVRVFGYLIRKKEIVVDEYEHVRPIRKYDERQMILW